MLRLLQGDVGSGKTMVGLMAAATVIEAGSQAVLMAPTELLARQHAKTLQRSGGCRRHPHGDPDRQGKRAGAG
jgi:RecG-like helicase